MFKKTKVLFAALTILVLSEAYAGPQITVTVLDSDGNPVTGQVLDCNPHFRVNVNSSAQGCITQIIWGTSPQYSHDCTSVIPPQSGSNYTFDCSCPPSPPATLPLYGATVKTTCGSTVVTQVYDIYNWP